MNIYATVRNGRKRLETVVIKPLKKLLRFHKVLYYERFRDVYITVYGTVQTVEYILI